MAEAEYQFGLAREHCKDCREYHAVWPYVWLTRARGDGLAADRETLGSLLQQHCPPKGKVLIAGAADFRLLALSHDALITRKARFAVTDRCHTPLLVCGHHAQAHGFRVDTFQSDFAQAPIAQHCDVVLSHNVLMWLPRAQHAAMLRGLASWLSRTGTLILVASRISASVEPDETTYPQRMVEALASRGIPLPEPEPAFRKRLAAYATLRNERRKHVASLDEIAREIESAGLRLSARIESDRPASGEAAIRASEIFVATRGD